MLHCGALVSDWATTEEIVAINVAGTRNLLEACVAASVRRFVHFSTTDVYGYPERPGDRRDVRDHALQQLVCADQAARPRQRSVARIPRARLETVVLRPATVYGPGSKDVIGEIARAIQGRHMLLIDGGRAIAGLCFVENLVDAAVLALRHEAAPGNAFNVSDGLAVTWRQLTDDLAEGLGCPNRRWSMPYPLASAIGLSLEHGYRLLRRATGLTSAAAALAPGSAGAGPQPGLQQPQAARDARLGAARRLRERSRGDRRVAHERSPRAAVALATLGKLSSWA